jgi:hypothetical protein
MKGTLLCPVCNTPVTGAKSTGKIGLRYEVGSAKREKHRHGYYRCFKPGNHFNKSSTVIDAALETLAFKVGAGAGKTRGCGGDLPCCLV